MVISSVLWLFWMEVFFYGIFPLWKLSTTHVSAAYSRLFDTLCRVHDVKQVFDPIDTVSFLVTFTIDGIIHTFVEQARL